jgi:hypothetical protein
MSAKAESGAGALPSGTPISGIIEQLMRACGERGDGTMSLGEVLNRIGRRSFGPLLLVLGLIGLAPISNIPGVVAVIATLDILVAGEMLIGMDSIWIPGALRRRKIRAARLNTILTALRPFARFADRVASPRLGFLTRGAFYYLLTVICFFVALALPAIEMIPLAGLIPNAAIVAVALAITAHDGVWALIAFAFAATTAYGISVAL